MSCSRIGFFRRDRGDAVCVASASDGNNVDRSRSRTPWHPFTTVVFIAAAVYVMIGSITSNPGNAARGAGLLLLGVPVYWYWRRQSGDADAGMRCREMPAQGTRHDGTRHGGTRHDGTRHEGSRMTSMIRVAGLFVHPIKSAAAISIDALTLDDRGAVADRRWLVVDPMACRSPRAKRLRLRWCGND